MLTRWLQAVSPSITAARSETHRFVTSPPQGLKNRAGRLPSLSLRVAVVRRADRRSPRPCRLEGLVHARPAEEVDDRDVDHAEEELPEHRRVQLPEQREQR